MAFVYWAVTGYFSKHKKSAIARFARSIAIKRADKLDHLFFLSVFAAGLYDTFGFLRGTHLIWRIYATTKRRQFATKEESDLPGGKL
jgi:hypothetical protein